MRFLTPFILVVLGCVAVSAAERGKPITITGRPRFDDRGRYTYLLLSDDKHSYELLWSRPPKVQFVPVTLDTNRVYTFTVVEEPFRSITIPNLFRVQQDGQTIYDLEVCEVHKTKMDHKKVKIYYGLILPGPDEPSATTERQSFPHRREYSLGGCAIGPDSPKATRVYVCTDCKKAYDKWKTDNKQSK